jgi:DNA-binding helix-hairpin-helix protein with protein kinase domain
MASKKIKVDTAANDGGAADLAVLPADAPKGTDLMAEAATVCESLCVTVIDSPIMYELAATELQELQAKYKALEDKRFAITRPMDAAKKAVMSLFNPALDRLNTAITGLKASMLEYDREEKRKAAIKQQLLDKIAADQKAALAAEAARQAEEARVQSERAAQLMEKGDSAGFNEAMTAAETAQEMAAALSQTGAVVSAATALTAVPTVAGITTADVWKARVTDLPALLRFVADHPEYHDWIEVKMTGLHDMAKAQRTELRVPGVEAFEESRIAAARKAA